ncbi:radical SAM protein, partial [Rhodococcus chondri]
MSKTKIGERADAKAGFELPDSAVAGAGTRPFGVYVHVPFCATRCGYCDFNTYTAGELGTAASPESWLEGLRREWAVGAEMLGNAGSAVPTADTVFVGGGTPSLLGADGLAEVLGAVRSTFGLAPGAEVTTESNPESTSPDFFARIREAGYTRVSLGMQSAAPHVLAVLDRTHTPGRPVAAAREARAAGFDHVTLA